MFGEQLSTQINDYLARYRLFVEQENQANRYNINIRAESFFLPILGLLYDCNNLENLNIEADKNFHGVDLGDREKRICVQVTSETNSQKVIDCLQKFNSDEYGLYIEYDRLIIFMIQNRQKSYSSNQISELSRKITEKNQRFTFNIKNDIADLSKISKMINDIELLDKQKILYYLQKEIDGDRSWPLTKFPNTNRPHINISMISREEEYEKISSSTDDLLVIGKPGIGKTFILYKLLQEKNAYFVTPKNIDKLEYQIKIVNPEELYIDDVHRYPQLFSDLLQIRTSLDKKFRIIVTSWPIDKLEQIKQIGNFNDNSTIFLKEFSKDMLSELIVELIKIKNVNRIFWLEQHIIDQSIGLPGVAVGLFEECCNKNAKNVIDGAAILSFVNIISQETLSPVDWNLVKIFMAYASLGDKFGFSIKQISLLTGHTKSTIKAHLQTIQYGGIIFEEKEQVVIRPQLLRARLVWEEFFSNGNSDLINEAIELINSKQFFLDLILKIAEIGLVVNENVLIDLLQKFGNRSQWEKFYWHYHERLIYLVEKYPETIEASIIPGLAYYPDHFLPIIFKIAEKYTSVQPNSTPEHPLRIIQYWIMDDYQSNITIEKRKKLLLNIEKYDHDNGDNELIAKLLAIILSPKFEVMKTLPGSGNQITMPYGFFSIEVIKEIAKLWPKIKTILQGIDEKHLTEILKSINDYIKPRWIIASVTDEMVEIMHNIAETILIDIIDLCSSHPNLLRDCKRHANELNLEIKWKKFEFYDLLFPGRDIARTNKLTEYKEGEIRRLAHDMNKESIQSIFEKTEWAYNESRLGSNSWPCMIPAFYEELVDCIETPYEYCKFLFEVEASPNIIIPFISKLVLINNENWEELLWQYVNNEKYLLSIAEIIFSMESPPYELFHHILGMLKNEHETWIEDEVLYSRFSISVMKELLVHKYERIRFAATIGEWKNSPSKEFRVELYDLCISILSETTLYHDLLEEIFSIHTHISKFWLINYLGTINYFVPNDNIHLLAIIIAKLSFEDKFELIDYILSCDKNVPDFIEIMRLIVGHDLDVFSYLLKNSNHDQINIVLSPIGTRPIDQRWCDKLLLAYRCGYSEDEIIQATLNSIFGRVYSGTLSEEYEKFLVDFRRLQEKKYEVELVNMIIENGIKAIEQNIRECKKIEEKEGIFGVSEYW